MAEQLAMFEPQGPQVLALAQKHAKDAFAIRRLAETTDTDGWMATSRALYAASERSDRLAAEMFMLAEFEALAGLS